LIYKSVAKCHAIPLVESLSFEDRESFDSLISKFTRIADVFTQEVIEIYRETLALSEELVSAIHQADQSINKLSFPHDR